MRIIVSGFAGGSFVPFYKTLCYETDHEIKNRIEYVFCFKLNTPFRFCYGCFYSIAP